MLCDKFLQEFVAEALIVVEVGAALCKLQNLSDQMWIQQYVDEIKPYHLNRGTFGLDTFGLNMIFFFHQWKHPKQQLGGGGGIYPTCSQCQHQKLLFSKKMNKNETLKKD